MLNKTDGLEIHKSSIVIDGHSDMLSDLAGRRDRGENNVLSRLWAPKFRKAGISAIICQTGSDTQHSAAHPMCHQIFNCSPYYPLKRTLQILDAVLLDIDESEDDILIVKKAADIEKAKKEDKLGIILSIEGTLALEGDLSILRQLHRLGIRSVQHVHHIRNRAGDPATELSPGGLTKFGVDLVNELNRLHMVIDTAHLSEGGFWDVLKNSKDPVIFSHGCVKSLCDHPRNLSDKQIKALAENGGVIGIHAIASFLSEEPRKAKLDDMFDHIDHAVEIAGIDHVGFGLHPGLTFLGVDKKLPNEAYKEFYGPCYDKLIGAIFTEGIQDVTDVPKITQGLYERGYSEKELRKFLGGNFLRVFNHVFGG